MFPRPHVLNLDRYEKAIAARDFFMRIYNACCDHICIENPVPLKIVGLPCHSQVIQPFMFGDPYSKMTYLWTKGLPRLIPTDVLSDYVSYISVCGSSQKVRSKSFRGISKAFATQYSAAILSSVNYSLPVQLYLSDWS